MHERGGGARAPAATTQTGDDGAFTFTRVRDLDHAIELANDTDYGLGASIYTSDLQTAMRAATELGETDASLWPPQYVRARPR